MSNLLTEHPKGHRHRDTRVVNSSELVPVQVYAVAHHDEGRWWDTSIKIEGVFAVAGEQYDEFVVALGALIDRYQI